MTNVEELRTYLHGSELEGRPVERGPRGTLLIPSFGEPSLLLADWRAARQTMPRTGMRPLAVTTDFSGDIELEVVLVMLPDTDPAAPAHYSSYFGADELPDGTEALGRVMRLWSQRWGAETVASWNAMLQYAVARQPASGDEAWEVAGQLLRVGTSLQLTRWELALAVERSSTWFLHDRP